MSQNGNKAHTICKAMILAAGLGTRLRPLTSRIPKPLLPIGGRPIIEHTLVLLKGAGIKKVVINLHHLGDKIRTRLGGGSKYGLEIHYSNEPAILGTGGGIKKAEGHFKDGPFVVINGDILIDIDIKKLIAFHLKSGGVATMVVRRLKQDEDYSRLAINKQGRLLGFGRGDYMFCGLQILNPVIFKFLKRPSCLIESGYKVLLKSGLVVNTYLHKGYWNDIGTHTRYNEALKRVQK